MRPIPPAPLIPDDAPWLQGGAEGVPVAEIKRLIERWAADRTFEARLRDDPLGAARSCGLTWHPEAVRALWDPTAPPSRAVDAYGDYMQCKIRYRDRVREACAPDEPRHRQWRERQVKRLCWQMGAAAEAHVHVPVSFSLSVGCSVGCWFCGLDAGPLQAVLPYDGNATLWRAVLEVVADVLGPAARWGFCYWATEPLDNPDYEDFLLDFHRVLGHFPQTTTAAPLRDVARTRRLLQLSAERGRHINRFSVLSLKMLERIHAAFTPQELLLVECLCQTPQARAHLARCGRAARAASGRGNAPEAAQPAGSIACVSGFLVHMVTREVELISPTPASARWPQGYRVHARATFADADGLRCRMAEMIERHMPPAVGALERVAFHPDLQVDPCGEGFVVASRHRRTTVAAPAGCEAAYRRLCAMLVEGCHRASAIAAAMALAHGVPEAVGTAALQGLFERGLLDEGPPP